MSDQQQTDKPEPQQFVTDDGRCGMCGTKVESWESEPADQVGTRYGALVALSVWTTLQPCGHSFKRATGADLD